MALRKTTSHQGKAPAPQTGGEAKSCASASSAKPVADRSQPGNLAQANRSQKGTVAEFLACMRFDRWTSTVGTCHGRDGIAQRDAGVGQPAALMMRPPPDRGLLDPIDEVALVVRLEGLTVRPSSAPRAQVLVDLAQGVVEP